jgi:hypothetical protein
VNSDIIENNNYVQEKLTLEMPTNTEPYILESNIFDFENYFACFLAWLIQICIIFPFIFGDLYFGYNDNTCIDEPTGKLLINLKDYLIVNGWILITLLSLIKINNVLINFNFTNLILMIINKFVNFILSLICIFIIVLNILGTVIFWSKIDTSKCSLNIYTYVYVSLIIKLYLIKIVLVEKIKYYKKIYYRQI